MLNIKKFSWGKLFFMVALVSLVQLVAGMEMEPVIPIPAPLFDTIGGRIKVYLSSIKNDTTDTLIIERYDQDFDDPNPTYVTPGTVASKSEPIQFKQNDAGIYSIVYSIKRGKEGEVLWLLEVGYIPATFKLIASLKEYDVGNVSKNMILDTVMNSTFTRVRADVNLIIRPSLDNSKVDLFVVGQNL